MDLKRRLAQRRAVEATVEEAHPAVRIPEPLPSPVRDEAHDARVARLKDMLDTLISRQRARAPEPRKAPLSPQRPAPGPLPGAEQETAYGKVHVISQILEPDHCHGKVGIARALLAKAEILSRLALDPGLGQIDPRRLLFLDTETTGLHGGTGTVPFLIGAAWFEDESLRVEQYLLRRPGDEAPILGVLGDRMRAASCLVTYNGKSYDLPLLMSRFVLARVEAPPVMPHLDLLHCARRVFRRRLGEMRLVTLEQRLLGFQREYDIDGHEIPGLYWSVVRGADPSALSPVVEHNTNDLVALAAILALLAEKYERLHREDDPTDHLGLAQVAARALDLERAVTFAEAAAGGGGDEALTVEALALAARLARKRGDHDGARIALERALAAGSCPELTAPVHLALAKLFEHKLRDLSRALFHARQTAIVEGEEAHERRICRLERRLRDDPDLA